MKKIFFLIPAILFYYISFAQFNDSTHYYVNYAGTGVLNKTNNTSSYVLTNALRFSVKEKNISLNSNSSWLYGQQQHHLTNNDFSSSLDFDLFKSFKHFYYWGLGNYDKSYSLKIINRLQVGLGGAYNLVDNKNAVLNISDGILYESSNLRIDSVTNDYYNTFRNSLRIKYRFVINNLLVIDGNNFLQNSLNNNNDYIIKSTTNLSIKLKKWLSFTSSATYNKLSRTHLENLLITFGLSTETYF